MKPAIILVAVLIGAFRPVLLVRDFGPHVDASYQAVAHLLVGGLFGAWLFARSQRQTWIKPNDAPLFHAWVGRWQLNTALVLTAIEVICAAITIYQKFT